MAEVSYKLPYKLYGESNLFMAGIFGGYVSDSGVISAAITLVEKAITEYSMAGGLIASE